MPIPERDIMVGGRNIHNKICTTNTEGSATTCKDFGVTFNLKKCEFGTATLQFDG